MKYLFTINFKITKTRKNFYVETEGELGKDCIQVNVAHPSSPELISPQDGGIVRSDSI